MGLAKHGFDKGKLAEFRQGTGSVRAWPLIIGAVFIEPELVHQNYIVANIARGSDLAQLVLELRPAVSARLVGREPEQHGMIAADFCQCLGKAPLDFRVDDGDLVIGRMAQSHIQGALVLRLDGEDLQKIKLGRLVGGLALANSGLDQHPTAIVRDQMAQVEIRQRSHTRSHPCLAGVRPTDPQLQQGTKKLRKICARFRPVPRTSVAQYLNQSAGRLIQGVRGTTITGVIMPVISTNNAANSALNYLNTNSNAETESISQLASGSRIVKASDDAAGLAIGTQLQAYSTVFSQDQTNVAQGTSILQSADGALAQISNVLQRMMALATEAASGQVTDTQRTQDINTEYQQLKTEITSISTSTTYAGQALLTGSFLSNVKFLVGTSSANTLTVSVATVSAGGLFSSGGSAITSSSLALSALSVINSAIQTVTKDRAKIGAYESQFNFSSQDIATNVINTEAAASTVLDADVASVKSALSSEDVKTQASIAALTQASQLPQELLKLIQA